MPQTLTSCVIYRHTVSNGAVLSWLPTYFNSTNKSVTKHITLSLFCFTSSPPLYSSCDWMKPVTCLLWLLSSLFQTVGNRLFIWPFNFFIVFLYLQYDPRVLEWGEQKKTHLASLVPVSTAVFLFIHLYTPYCIFKTEAAFYSTLLCTSESLKCRQRIFHDLLSDCYIRRCLWTWAEGVADWIPRTFYRILSYFTSILDQ